MTSDGLDEVAANITSKKDLAEFIVMLQENLKTSQDEWENDRLDLFLDALAAYLDDCDVDELSWCFVAGSLLAAKIYE